MAQAPIIRIGTVIHIGKVEYTCTQITKTDIQLHDKALGKHIRVSHERIEKALAGSKETL